MLPPNCIVTKSCALLALLLIGGTAGADPIGKVRDASGLLLAKAATGTIKVLAVGSDVDQGEILFTRADTYARIDLSDQSSVALGPNTELSVATYSFHPASEDPTDMASLKLLHGRVRVSSGILGTRHPNSFTLVAGATTVDIQHSAFIAEYVQLGSSEVARRDFEMPGGGAAAIADGGTAARASRHAIDLSTAYSTGVYRNVSLRLAQNIPVPSTLSPGLYVQVLDGMVTLSNTGGSQNFAAGQFGFTPNFQQPPVILPKNPGLQFTPPPSFSSNTGSQGTGGGKPGDVDCIVR
jgi:hypothetical protein